MSSLLLLNLFLGFFGAWFMANYAFRFGLVDLPNERSSHVVPTPRGDKCRQMPQMPGQMPGRTRTTV